MILEVTCTSGRRYAFSKVAKVTWDQGCVEFYDEDHTLVGLVYGCEAVSRTDTDEIPEPVTDKDKDEEE